MRLNFIINNKKIIFFSYNIIMTSQIFKSKFPKQLLFDLLDQVATVTEKRYIFNRSAYKKGHAEDNNIIQEFVDSCKDYYYLSKHKYLDKKLTYNSFVTVLRQICNFNNIIYTSKIVYFKSGYDIEYSIYKDY
jgi:hypothetical protein